MKRKALILLTIIAVVSLSACSNKPAPVSDDGESNLAQLNGRITKIANAKNGLLASMGLFSPAVCVDVSITISMRGGLSDGK